MSDGHFGDVSPLSCFFGWGGDPASNSSIQFRFLISIDERNSVSSGVLSDKLSSAVTPSASPALRIRGCSMEASYCANLSQGTVQIGGKLTGASLACRFF